MVPDYKYLWNIAVQTMNKCCFVKVVPTSGIVELVQNKKNHIKEVLNSSAFLVWLFSDMKQKQIMLPFYTISDNFSVIAW